MKNLITITLISLILASCGSYRRMGDLTEISNRNVDNSFDYVLFARDVKSVVKAEKDALEQAIDKLTSNYRGEFLRNVEVFIKKNGKKVKLEADVWGLKRNFSKGLEVGDKVVFKLKKSFVEGKIIGIDAEKAVIEYGKKNKRIEMNIFELSIAEENK